ncbi:hypothetical protein OAH47_02480 [Flavobacteriaceae bacterium]|nr:hypothetical protein [Flavobacteriaceae bacterium]
MNIIPNYIDPGTGSLLISLLISFVLSIIFSVRTLFYKIILFFSGKEHKGSNDFENKLVFYCEGKNYWNVFKPVLDELIKNKQKFIYLTSDNDDIGLQINSEFCSSYYIGNINQSFFFLNKLKAKMCVTTTPQLNILAWKRSKNVKHYCYLSHAPMDVHANKKFSFDYYDSVLCGNNYQITNLRQLERDRKSKAKVLMKTGCTYYDLITENNCDQKDFILISPTWGERSFFSLNGEVLVKELLKGKHKVLYRPHPQSWISEKKFIDSITLKFQSNESFEVDNRVNNSYALSNAKAMITDTSSGIIYDVAFLHKIPIIAVNFKYDDGGYESSNIENPPSTKYLLEDCGEIISEDEISDINTIIKKVTKFKITKEIIDKHIFNFHIAGKVAAKQILTIYKNIE